nr:cytochrome P450 CYP736A12-like [Ipomoea batatas]
MINTAWILAAIAVIAAVSIFSGFLKNRSKRLPPGPKGLPILGHLHLIGKNPHQDLHELAKTHGPIMHLRFGFVDNIIVSSAETAEQFLKTHDLVFATRPPHQAAKYLSYDQKNLSFGEYGPYWRNMRKLCTLELLSNLKINSFQSMRREELCVLVESLKQAARDGVAVDLSAKVASMSADMSSMSLAAIPNLGDYFPYLGKLDLQGLTRRMKAVSKLFDEFFERIIDEHECATNKGTTQVTRDFVDTMLDIMKSGGESTFQFTREHVKTIMLDMLAGSMDTSSTVVEWIMSELLRHPEVMKKLKEELERQVGLDRMVEEEDLEHLEYLEMVLKESLRIHPVAPLLLPHAAIEDCMVNGFHIPKRARVIVNIWAIGHDPNVWSDPEKFIPNRFNGSNIEYRDRDFELIPFGSGRRSCPGLQLGITVVRLLVAQLVHCFDWDLPNGMSSKDLDMTEEFGLVVSRAKHLMAIPTYRLHL